MNEPRRLLLIGGGGHAAVVAEAAAAAGWSVVGFLDDDPETEASGAKVGMKRLGAIHDATAVACSIGGEVTVHAATGNAQLRRQWLASLGEAALHRIDYSPIIHSSAVVSPSARLGEATFIAPRAVVNARSMIGRGVIVNSGAIVEHDVSVGDFAHLAPGSVVAGGAAVSEGSLVGCGAIVLPGVSIGRGATLGAGAVATRDVPGGGTAVGAPARVLAPKFAK